MAESAKKWDDWSSKISQRKRHYETVFIVSPSIEDAKLNELLEKLTRTLTDGSAEVLRQDNWGKMRMAYEIEKRNTGNYFYYRYIGPMNVVKAFERALKLDASILRYQTVRLSEDLTDEEVESLIQKAPKEASIPPNASQDDETSDFH